MVLLFNGFQVIFLTGDFKFDTIRRYLSKEFIASSGVPQGSILGPLFFNVFINDITADLNCGCLLFADDMKLYLKISSRADCVTLQENLKLVESWCLRNCMSLNLDKCLCITFSRAAAQEIFPYTLGGQDLCRVSRVRDLGVMISSTLSWDHHVHAACNRATRCLGLIYRMRSDIQNILALKVLYCSLVRPHLEYCSVVWSPHQSYLKDVIESIQGRFLRLVGMQLGYRYSEVPLHDMAQLLDLPTLETRRFHQDVLFLYRLVNSQLDCPQLLGGIYFRVPFGTRSRDVFVRPSVSTNYAMNSSLVRIQLHGNSLPEGFDFFGDSYSVFKSKLRRLL